jgi:hypothetical protein
VKFFKVGITKNFKDLQWFVFYVMRTTIR